MAQDNKYVDMRTMLKRMRNASSGTGYVPKEEISEAMKNMNIREMKKRMRKYTDLQEAEVNKEVLPPDEQRKEEDKLRNVFNNNNVTIEFEPFEIYNDEEGKKVLFGGTVDGQIMFSYSVTPRENSSGVDIQYLEGFDPNDPENQEIIEKLKRYYNDFYQNWRNNLFYV